MNRDKLHFRAIDSDRQCRGTGLTCRAKNCIDGLRGIAFDDLLGNGIGTTDLTKHTGTAAWNTLLGLWIDLNQAKAYMPAIIPFKIIDQRPMKIATDWNALTQRSMYHCQVLQNCTRTTIILHIG